MTTSPVQGYQPVSDNRQWEPIGDQAGWLAPNNEEVWTKIDDDRGIRNVAKLTRKGSLWWTAPTGGMYVYYTPTHWSRP